MSSPVDPACTNSLSQRARGRSFTGITNLSPDHTSLIAHTLTSTSPAARPRARTLFSSRSLTTPELFLGHATHNMPAGSSLLLHGGKLFFRSAWVLTKSKTKSGGSCSAISHRAIASFSSAFTSGGMPGRAIRVRSLLPSFLGRGVSEYQPMLPPIAPGRNNRDGSGHGNFSDLP